LDSPEGKQLSRIMTHAGADSLEQLLPELPPLVGGGYIVQ
jgi:hypothetical protein